VESSSQIITTNKPTSSFSTGRMSFLSPNQQCQSTEGKQKIIFMCLYLSKLFSIMVGSFFPRHGVDYCLCGRVPDLQLGGCKFESRPGLLHTKVYSAFHPSGVGK